MPTKTLQATFLKNLAIYIQCIRYFSLYYQQTAQTTTSRVRRLGPFNLQGKAQQAQVLAIMGESGVSEDLRGLRTKGINFNRLQEHRGKRHLQGGR